MDIRTFVFAGRPDLHRQADTIFSAGWPEFIFHDSVADRHMARTHHRLGARMLCPAERFMVMTGSVADW